MENKWKLVLFFFFHEDGEDCEDGGVLKKIQFSEKLKKKTPGLLLFFTWLLSFVSFIFFVHIYSSFWIKIMTVWNLVIFGGHDESNSSVFWRNMRNFECFHMWTCFLTWKKAFCVPKNAHFWIQRISYFYNIFQSAMTFPRGLHIFIFTIWRVV